jgi:hypothetical protein
MGDLVDFIAYKKKKETSFCYEDELNRLWVVILIWSPYAFARERQLNDRWMEMFFYQDKDW